MKRAFIIVLWMSAIMLPAVAEEPVPYAYRPPAIGESYVPSLAAIMRALQFGHIKLAYAGKLGNWGLANYKLGQIQESLMSAGRWRMRSTTAGQVDNRNKWSNSVQFACRNDIRRKGHSIHIVS